MVHDDRSEKKKDQSSTCDRFEREFCSVAAPEAVVQEMRRIIRGRKPAEETLATVRRGDLSLAPRQEHGVIARLQEMLVSAGYLRREHADIEQRQVEFRTVGTLGPRTEEALRAITRAGGRESGCLDSQSLKIVESKLKQPTLRLRSTEELIQRQKPFHWGEPYKSFSSQLIEVSPAMSGPVQKSKEVPPLRDGVTIRANSPGPHDSLGGYTKKQVTGYEKGRALPLTVYHVADGVWLVREAAEAFLKMEEAIRKDPRFTAITLRAYNENSFREMVKAQALYEGRRIAERLASQGDPNAMRYFHAAARPGYSNHQLGRAVDVFGASDPSSRVSQALSQYGPRFGFNPLPKERWHWEYSGKTKNR
jgi:hypothetical protein